MSFYLSGRGVRFFEGQVPRAVAALEAIAKAMVGDREKKKEKIELEMNLIKKKLKLLEEIEARVHRDKHSATREVSKETLEIIAKIFP